jgi:hypothetical protein
LIILNNLKNLLLIYLYLGMTTGHRIEPKTFQMRKRLKKTALNAKITREPFGDKSIKILPIPIFIDDYNHYMGGWTNQISSEPLLPLISLEIKKNSF